MKRFLRIVTIACVIIILLSTLSLKTTKAKILSSNWSVSHSRFSSRSSTPPSASFQGVATVSANDIWAVGSYCDAGISCFPSNPRTINGTLIEQWNGTAWSIVPSPSPGAYNNDLIGVSAISTNDVWAVGWYSNVGGPYQTLTEHWNGTQWSIVPSPSPGPVFNFLYGVTAVSTSDVWTVGNTGKGNTGLTLTEQWNGTQWSVVKSPSRGGSGGTSELLGVAAVSANDIWAVGDYLSFANGNYAVLTLTEQWNGTKWSVVKSPSHGKSSSILKGVAVVSANDIWAVGLYSNSVGFDRTLVEQWNGTTWSIVKSPNPGMTV